MTLLFAPNLLPSTFNRECTCKRCFNTQVSVQCNKCGNNDVPLSWLLRLFIHEPYYYWVEISAHTMIKGTVHPCQPSFYLNAFKHVSQSTSGTKTSQNYPTSTGTIYIYIYLVVPSDIYGKNTFFPFLLLHFYLYPSCFCSKVLNSLFGFSCFFCYGLLHSSRC